MRSGQGTAFAIIRSSPSSARHVLADEGFFLPFHEGLCGPDAWRQGALTAVTVAELIEKRLALAFLVGQRTRITHQPRANGRG